MMPRSQSSSALSNLRSFSAMREMVSGTWICCPTRAVHGAVLPPAAAAGTSCRFPRSSPALFSAFSILLMSQHSQETHYGERRRKGKCGRNNQRQYRQFLTQTDEGFWTPKMRHDRRDRDAVSLRNRAGHTNARIELHSRVKQPDGNQDAERDFAETQRPGRGD